MIKGKEPLSLKDFVKGLVTRSDFLKGDLQSSPDCMDIKFTFDGGIAKRLGSSTTNTIAITSQGAGGWVTEATAGTLITNLNHYWKLDEPSGSRGDTKDSLPLQDKSGILSAQGIRGDAALFTLANSAFLMAENTASIQSGGTNFSIAGWFYLNSTSTTQQRTIIAKRDPGFENKTVLLIHADSSITDSSAYAKTVTTSGTVIDNTVFWGGSGSWKFNGSSDFGSVADSPDWDFNNEDFTVELYRRHSSITSFPQCFISRNNVDLRIQQNNSTTMEVAIMGLTPITATYNATTGSFEHIALTRASGNLRLFVGGSQIGATASNSDDIQGTAALLFGIAGGTNFFNGWLDEVRVTRGLAKYVANFTPLAKPFTVQSFEHWLTVNSDNQLVFSVSSSNLAANGTVIASSAGALNTATWYRFVAWHSNNSHIGIDVNLSVNTAAYTSGVKTGSAPFTIGAMSNGLIDFVDARIDEVGYWAKVLTSVERSSLYNSGAGNTLTLSNDPQSWASFDFGASAIRWLTVSAGTGIMASSNLGTTFVNIATTRTATYQSLNRSKNVLIATSDAYDVPLYWAGSAGTFASALAVGSAPSVKYSVNYNGFLILLNSSTRTRGFFYEDENTQLTGAWTNSFDIPSSADDEITNAFILNKFLYISTRYTIFRLLFVGGNPDWSYLKVKDFGYVPRTVRIVSLKGGQVAIGLDWQRRLRVFDGEDDLYISDPIENDNGMCNFAMSKVSQAGSGLIVSFAENDTVEQEYRLALAIGEDSTNTTHQLVLNNRTLAMYPYQNQPFNTMCMAESNRIQHLMAFDRSGYCHILNSGNTDVSRPIDDHYDSPILFRSTPQTVTKNQEIDMYFKRASCGTVYYMDRADLSSVYSTPKALKEMALAESCVELVRTLDLPSLQNTYQFRLMSSANTANPWQLNRADALSVGLGIGKG